MAATVAWSGCDRNPAPSNPPGDTVGASVTTATSDHVALSPKETVGRVNELRRAGYYTRLEWHVLPDQRSDVLALIQSVDQLLSANSVLQTAIRTHLGSATAGAFDRSQVGNIIGAFSMDVVVHDERITGDWATVTIEVGGRLPLESVELVRLDEQWVIRTDRPRPEVAGHLQRMADVMTDIAREVRTKSLTATQIHRELDMRLSPSVRRITAAVKAGEGK